MKREKNKESPDEIRNEYRRSDLGKIVRGKYAKRLGASSNVVVLRPEIARVFPNDQAVNEALQALIDVAAFAGGRKGRPSRPARKTAVR